MRSRGQVPQGLRPSGVRQRVRDLYAAAAELLGALKQLAVCLAEEGKGVMFGGSEKVRFPQGALSAAEAWEKTSVGSQAGVKVGSVLGELPSLGLQREALRDERPV